MHHHKVKKKKERKKKTQFTQEPLNLGRYAHLDGWAISGPACVCGSLQNNTNTKKWKILHSVSVCTELAVWFQMSAKAVFVHL